MRSDASEKDRTAHGLVDCWLPMDRKKRIYVKGVDITGASRGLGILCAFGCDPERDSFVHARRVGDRR